MQNTDKGFSTPLAMTVIFSLSIIALSFYMLVTSNEKKINAYKKSVESQQDASSIIFSMENSLQLLKNIPSDSSDNTIIYSLLSSVCNYSFTVTDISTGINKTFLSESFLDSQSIRNYLRINNNNVVSDYGWINPKFVDSSVIKNISKDFNNKNLFPLVNSMPLYNIHFMNKDFIEAILKYYNISNAEQKSILIINKLTEETTIKEISEILEINEDNSLFDLIGLKTSFWNVSFETEKCYCSAIFAAIPEKDNPRKVEKYLLVEKRIISKGGTV